MAKKNRYKNPQTQKGRKDVSLFLRASVRSLAVLAIFSTAFYGITAGGHITDPNSVLYNVSGRVAGQFGYAAREIRIAGLKRQKPQAVLRAINVLPNDSLIGFRAAQAKSVLELVDWVKKAEVRRIYPNQLEIDIEERVPFAIWQRDGEFYVIDKNGAAFTSVDPSQEKDLLVVTGEGAHKKVFELVNHLEAHSGLKSLIIAAGRVGQRRWNLYLRGGLKVMLPENRLAEGLNRLDRLEKATGLFDKDVAVIDLRLAGQTSVSVGRDISKEIKVSQR